MLASIFWVLCLVPSWHYLQLPGATPAAGAVSAAHRRGLSVLLPAARRARTEQRQLPVSPRSGLRLRSTGAVRARGLGRAAPWLLRRSVASTEQSVPPRSADRSRHTCGRGESCCFGAGCCSTPCVRSCRFPSCCAACCTSRSMFSLLGIALLTILAVQKRLTRRERLDALRRDRADSAAARRLGSRLERRDPRDHGLSRRLGWRWTAGISLGRRSRR